MTTENEKAMQDVARYYTAKLEEHGVTARGVDWKSEESQILRFEQLVGVIDDPGGFSVSDWGCGYGALYEFLAARWPGVSYTGWDISPAMVEAARDRFRDDNAARFVLSGEPSGIFDYAFASGIFNVRLETSDDEWLEFIQAGIDRLDRTSRKAFAFNCLTRYSDPDKQRDYLYYADPGLLFDRCVARYSPNVALLHGYRLFEFTILVRKQP